MKDITVQCFVIDKADNPIQIRSGELRHCWVADNTASILATTMLPEAKYINEGDVLTLSKCRVSLHQGQVQLFIGKIVRIGEFSMAFTDRPNMSHMEWGEEETGQPVPTAELVYHHWADRPSEPVVVKTNPRLGPQNRSSEPIARNSQNDSNHRGRRPPYNSRGRGHTMRSTFNNDSSDSAQSGPAFRRALPMQSSTLHHYRPPRRQSQMSARQYPDSSHQHQTSYGLQSISGDDEYNNKRKRLD
ncbi:hypothetical protein BDEG_25813 [Batrachochytrium dendrobatidis JEL423]|uniref:Uncharacterized protein n=1 Tax=Batrachochytrium dendrobatidis (strain JEL423) TaxID=403673 RepID=A0A177WRA8_BATDL|nr:hypothetical protein BDEG_25813 [Batrachochytrium dendrobatidis JEL423]